MTMEHDTILNGIKVMTKLMSEYFFLHDLLGLHNILLNYFYCRFINHYCKEVTPVTYYMVSYYCKALYLIFCLFF